MEITLKTRTQRWKSDDAKFALPASTRLRLMRRSRRSSTMADKGRQSVRDGFLRVCMCDHLAHCLLGSPLSRRCHLDHERYLLHRSTADLDDIRFAAFFELSQIAIADVRLSQAIRRAAPARLFASRPTIRAARSTAHGLARTTSSCETSRLTATGLVSGFCRAGWRFSSSAATPSARSSHRFGLSSAYAKPSVLSRV